MNLLIQSIINKLVSHKILESDDVEHYSNICAHKDSYELESAKAGWGDDCNNKGSKCFPTLEDYLLKTDKIDIPTVLKWLKQIFKTLDKLYDTIQFHHCDPKAAQILLTEKGDATVGDLDKITFTLNINNIPYRIRLKRGKNYIEGIGISTWENIGQLNNAVSMRFESRPRTDCVYEKFCFLSSICLLSGDKDTAEKIAIGGTKLIQKDCDVRHELCNDIYLNIPGNFNFSSKNRKKQRSLGVPASYVHTKKKQFTDLKSLISLNSNKNTPYLSINNA